MDTRTIEMVAHHLAHAAAMQIQQPWDWPAVFRSQDGVPWEIAGEADLEARVDAGETPPSVLSQARRYATSVQHLRLFCSGLLHAAAASMQEGDDEFVGIGGVLDQYEQWHWRQSGGQGAQVLHDARVVIAYALSSSGADPLAPRIVDQDDLPCLPSRLSWAVLLPLAVTGVVWLPLSGHIRLSD